MNSLHLLKKATVVDFNLALSINDAFRLKKEGQFRLRQINGNVSMQVRKKLLPIRENRCFLKTVIERLS